MNQEWTWNGACHQMKNELIVSELNFDLDQLSKASSSIRVDPGSWVVVSKYSKVLYSGKIG